METRLTIKPGQKGTRRLVAQYGRSLVCVRYRYDTARQKRYKTVELIVEEIDWRPKPKRPAGDSIVGVTVVWGEAELARQVKNAGGKWNAQKKLWEIRYDRALALGLEKRIVLPTSK